MMIMMMKPMMINTCYLTTGTTWSGTTKNAWGFPQSIHPHSRRLACSFGGTAKLTTKESRRGW